jgi:hypothetical protein
MLNMATTLYTRQQLEDAGLSNTYPYSMFTQASLALHRGYVDKLHLFHSDVYYVRAAMEKRTGYVFPLDKVEEAMRAEGWKEHRHLPRKDKYDQKRQ